MKVREVLRRLDEDGWQLVRTRGSHRVLHHAHKPGIVVVPGNHGDEIPPGTLRAIFKQAQIEEQLS
jgi:predicted RNA binding protein YcfA (HicA-like mRNA interferase family)